jgi:hypothetical protein
MAFEIGTSEAGFVPGRAFIKPHCRFCEPDSGEGGAPAAAALLVAAFRLFVFAARFRADFSFRFRIVFFAADILTVRMSILSGRSHAAFTAIRLGYF